MQQSKASRVETGASSGQEILQLRAVLRNISPLISRPLLVRGDTSVARLHQILQVAFGWQDMHLHRFEIRGREYGVHQEGGVFFDTDAHKALISELKLRRLERFTYEYDFGDLWVHDLRIEATLPLDPKRVYPVCIAGRRAAPPEDCGGPHAFMVHRLGYALIGVARRQVKRPLCCPARMAPVRLLPWNSSGFKRCSDGWRQ